MKKRSINTPTRLAPHAASTAGMPELRLTHGLSNIGTISPSPQHREGVKDVMRFNEPMYKVGEQNSVCMSCHLPEQLQKAFWPHDVHVTKVACASCHSLHPQQDTMQTLSDKGRIKICVDCHSDQRTNPNFNPASVPLLKEQP
jgi:cytochrome c-type protein NrfB